MGKEGSMFGLDDAEIQVEPILRRPAANIRPDEISPDADLEQHIFKDGENGEVVDTSVLHVNRTAALRLDPTVRSSTFRRGRVHEHINEDHSFHGQPNELSHPDLGDDADLSNIKKLRDLSQSIRNKRKHFRT